MTLTTLCSAPPIPSWPWPLTVPRTTSERDYLLIETFGLDNSFTKMTTSQWFCFCNTLIFPKTKDLIKDKILRENWYQRNSCLLSFISSRNLLFVQHQVLTKGFESNNTSVFSIYFLFIDDHLHTNFYTVMFHLVSINLLKLFLRFILFLPGSLYVGSYRPHIGLGARKCNFLESDGNSIFLNLVMKVWLSSSSAEARLSASNVRAFERKERKLKSANYSFFLLKI